MKLNLQKVTQKKTKPFATVEAEKTTELAPQNSLAFPLPKRKGVDYPLIISSIFLLLGFGFFSFAGYNLYAQTRISDQSRYITECEAVASRAEKAGISVDIDRCKGSQNITAILSHAQTVSEIELVTQEFEDAITNLKNESTALSQEITQIEEKLDVLNPQWRSQVPSESFNETLFEQVATLKRLIEVRNNLLSEAVLNIDTNVAELNTLLLENTSIDFNTEKAFFDSYTSLSKEEQISQYADLLNTIEVVKTKITAQQADAAIPIPSTAFAQPSIDQLQQYKVFTPGQFQVVADTTTYANVNPPSESPSITGNEAADARIVEIATGRGYKRRPEAVSNPSLASGFALQTSAATAFEQMRQAALQDGVSLGVVSGFRSVADQRAIFLRELANKGYANIGREYTPEEIANGTADSAIDSILTLSSIPGYSKHHTGYTIDVSDLGSGQGFTLFKNTRGYAWLAANNFYNAKRFGYIPSYPEGGTNFGPNPEAWEYSWVGVDVLRA